MAKKSKKIEKIKEDIRKHPSPRVYRKPDKFGNMGPNIYDRKKHKKVKRPDVLPMTAKDHPYIGKITLSEARAKIRNRNHNPYQPPRLMHGDGELPVVNPLNNQQLDDMNSNYDNQIYLESLAKTGLRYTFDSEGNLVQLRDEYECITYNTCGSGGDPYDPDSHYYYGNGFDSSGNTFATNAADQWTNSNIGDCSYWPDIWGPEASSEICAEMCAVWCAGDNTITGLDGQSYTPPYSTSHSHDSPPDDMWSHCGQVSVHPEDCSTYKPVRAHWHTAQCKWDSWIDTNCHCRCGNQRANLIQNQLDTDGDGYGDVPQIQACLNVNACNYGGNYQQGIPSGTYSWCSLPQYQEYCTAQEGLCDYSCVGCTDPTAPDTYSPEYTIACDSTNSDCTGYNCCCEYDNIKQTASRFKISYAWDDTQVRLYGDSFINEFGKNHVFWTRNIKVSKGQSINWDEYAPGIDSEFSNTGLYPKKDETFWLAWVEHGDVCYEPAEENELTGTIGSLVCCNGEDCNPSIQCGTGDAAGYGRSIFNTNADTGYEPNCVRKNKLEWDNNIQETSGMMQYRHHRTDGGSSDTGHQGTGLFILNPLFGLSQGLTDYAGPLVTWSLNDDNIDVGQVTEVYGIGSSFDTQWSMNIQLDNGGTYKTFKINDPSDFQYGEYIVNTKSGMFRRLDVSRGYYEGIYNLDTTQILSSDYGGEPGIYCEDWEGTSRNYCGYIELNFCDNTLDSEVDNNWVGLDNFNDVNNGLWEDVNRNPGKAWYDSPPAAGYDGGEGREPCRANNVTEGHSSQPGPHVSVSKSVLYDRPEDYKFKNGSCRTGPVPGNSNAKTFKGYFPVDNITVPNPDGTSEGRNMITGPIMGTVIDGDGPDDTVRQGSFKSGCLGPLGGCFDCAGAQTEYLCNSHEYRGCHWEPDNDDNGTGVCLCHQADSFAEDGTTCCSEEDISLLGSCLPGKDDFNLCFGLQDGLGPSPVGSGIFDGDFSQMCAVDTYDAIFIYNTGTILDGRGGNEEQSLDVNNFQSGFSQVQNWNPGIVGYGPNPTVNVHGPLKIADSVNDIGDIGFGSDLFDRDLRRLNGNFDNMIRQDHIFVQGKSYDRRCFNYYDNMYENDDCKQGNWNVEVPNSTYDIRGNMIQVGAKRKNLIIPQIVAAEVKYSYDENFQGHNLIGDQLWAVYFWRNPSYQTNDLSNISISANPFYPHLTTDGHNGGPDCTIGIPDSCEPMFGLGTDYDLSLLHDISYVAQVPWDVIADPVYGTDFKIEDIIDFNQTGAQLVSGGVGTSYQFYNNFDGSYEDTGETLFTVMMATDIWVDASSGPILLSGFAEFDQYGTIYVEHTQYGNSTLNNATKIVDSSFSGGPTYFEHYLNDTGIHRVMVVYNNNMGGDRVRLGFDITNTYGIRGGGLPIDGNFTYNMDTEEIPSNFPTNTWDEEFTVKFELLGDHSHQDVHAGNKWNGINNYDPLTGFGNGNGTFNHRLGSDQISALEGYSMDWRYNACHYVEPDHGGYGDDLANDDWPCVYDVSNDDEDISRHYMVKSVYAINATNTMDDYYPYDPLKSLMNYVLVLGSLYEFAQYHSEFVSSGLDFPSGIMPYCKDHVYNYSEYMPNCRPTESWVEQDYIDYCFTPGKLAFFEALSTWWYGNGNTGSSLQYPYFNRSNESREITLGANKYTIDLFCQSLGFDAGRVLSWGTTNRGCSNTNRLFKFEPYYSDGSNPYEGDVPKLFIPHAQADVPDLQSNEGWDRNIWPAKTPTMLPDYLEYSDWDDTIDGTGYRGVSTNMGNDLGDYSGFFCPYGGPVRPYDVSCYNHDIWSPAQNYMYGPANHNRYQPRCDSFYNKDDFRAWFRAYYFAYYDRRMSWKDAFEHPLFGEEVPYYVAVNDPDNQQVRECGPEIIVLPATSFVRRKNLTGLGNNFGDQDWDDIVDYPDSWDVYNPGEFKDAQAFWPGYSDPDGNNSKGIIPQWNRWIDGLKNSFLVPVHVTNQGAWPGSGMEIDYSDTHPGMNGSLYQTVNLGGFNNVDYAQVIIQDNNKSCGSCLTNQYCSVSVLGGSHCQNGDPPTGGSGQQWYEDGEGECGAQYLSTLPFPQYWEELNADGNQYLNAFDATVWSRVSDGLCRPDIAEAVERSVLGLPPSDDSEYAFPSYTSTWGSSIPMGGVSAMSPLMFANPACCDRLGGTRIVIEDDGSQEIMNRAYYEPSDPEGTHEGVVE